ncbi:putative origin recognition complex subunit 6 [Golovinomyces cichoracearum]|uniref:Putative origin recognition complex subunit 6 n=1 Tax=Golovinomyces cichoracearum TaxID=62708 RepID=A0A420J6W3_9PEZI|nr:putative origin recognition complex subunit 6 [Golovinomyces cichoracearum]
MNRSIEQVIENLVPRYSDTIPTALVELANSLFVQSRSKCTLKAEEEIARLYACANLACERLRSQLNLPPIEPRPPIPPRAYDKLYAYLQTQLEPKTPSKKCSRSRANTPLSRTRLTPSKSTLTHSVQRERPTVGAQSWKLKDPKKNSTKNSSDEKESKVPRYVAPIIRMLCKQMQTPKAIPHVIAGVESILCLSRPEKMVNEPINNSNFTLPALIAAVWFFVVGKMRGREEQWRENTKRKREVREFLENAREIKTLQEKTSGDEESWKDWKSITQKDINEWGKEIIAGKWKEMDWWRNIVEGTGVENTPAQDDSAVSSDQDEEMQDGEEHTNFKHMEVAKRYDYLTEERRKEYAEWSKNIQSRIKELIASKEAEGTTDHSTRNVTVEEMN